ncbi:MAG: hypothetical protein ACK4OP_02345 [Gemmobacter sp.]
MAAEYRIVLIAAAAFGGAALLNALLGRLGWRWMVRGVNGLAVAAIVVGTALSQALEGWEALGWFVFVLVMGLPAVAGALLGGWWGLRERRDG